MKLFEINAMQQAKAEVGNRPNQQDRMAQARMNDQQLIKQRAADIESERLQLAASTDPIDKQILVLKQKIQQMQQQLDTLVQKKNRGSN